MLWSGGAITKMGHFYYSENLYKYYACIKADLFAVIELAEEIRNKYLSIEENLEIYEERPADYTKDKYRMLINIREKWLKQTLKRINKLLSQSLIKKNKKNVEYPIPYLHSSLKKRSYNTNVKAHKNHKYILAIDLKTFYPSLEVTAIVRGLPALNDATMDDARQIGLTDLVNVIGNGTDIAGTVFDKISKEAQTALQEADVIISKGLGNFETLNGCGLNVYYLFMCKCKMFAEKFQKNLFEGILINDRSIV